MLELYQRVSLNRDFPESNLKKGDIATLVDTVPHPTGESINVIVVPRSAVEPLKQDEILSVRSLVEVK